MNYNFNIVVPPAIHGFEPMRSQQELIDRIAKNKSVTIEVSNQTKTSLRVSVASEMCKAACSYIPKGAEHLKFHEAFRTNIWTGGGSYCNYFKVLKSQKWPEFKEYLTCLLNSLNIPEITELEVKVELNEELREKLEAPNYATV